jgi:hypothetical protein
MSEDDDYVAHMTNIMCILEHRNNEVDSNAAPYQFTCLVMGI